MTGTAVATSPKQTIAELLTSKADRITPFLPKGVEIDRVIAAAQIAMQKNPALMQCTPQSMVLAVAKIQQWGLEIGDTAHLVPFGKDCVPIADYKGLVQLIWQSKVVRNVECRPVYEKEHFRVEYGLDPLLEHIPLHRTLERGKLSGAYVIFFLPFGARTFLFMGIEDVDAIRKKHSKQWKDGECPAWYAMKTCIRQGVKLLPKDPRLADVLRVTREDEDAELDNPPLDQPVTNLGKPPEPATTVHADEDDLLADDRAMIANEGA